MVYHGLEYLLASRCVRDLNSAGLFYCPNKYHHYTHLRHSSLKRTLNFAVFKVTQKHNCII